MKKIYNKYTPTNCIIRFATSLTLLLTSLLISVSGLSAQEEPQATVEFATLSWDKTIRDLYYFNGDEPVPVIVPNGSPGREMKYRGETQLTFYTQGKDSEGKIIDQSVGVVNFPEGDSSRLLLFVKSGDVGRYRILSLNSDLDGFPLGAFKFCNLTDHRIALKVGEYGVSLESKENEVISLPQQEKTNVSVRLAAIDGGEEWELIYRSLWASPGNRRAWVFVYDDASEHNVIRKYYQAQALRQVQSTDPL
jgi:hypothetical protein